MSLFDPALQDEITVPIDMVPHSNIPIVLVGVLGAVAWFAVGLRIFTRAYLIRSFGWDDATMIIALVCLYSNINDRPNSHKGIL
jgi:hypothetical protein